MDTGSASKDEYPILEKMVCSCQASEELFLLTCTEPTLLLPLCRSHWPPPVHSMTSFLLDHRVPVRMLRNPEQQWVSFGYKKPHPFLHVKHDGIYNNNILLLATAHNIPGVPVTGLCLLRPVHSPILIDIRPILWIRKQS